MPMGWQAVAVISAGAAGAVAWEAHEIRSNCSVTTSISSTSSVSVRHVGRDLFDHRHAQDNDTRTGAWQKDQRPHTLAAAEN